MIRNGIDRVTDAPYRSLLEHLRLGLVSNMSGISPRHGWRSTVDVLPKLFTVSCLFASEHGVRGVLGPGEKVSDGRDELTGLYTHPSLRIWCFLPARTGQTRHMRRVRTVCGMRICWCSICRMSGHATSPMLPRCSAPCVPAPRTGYRCACLTVPIRWAGW